MCDQTWLLFTASYTLLTTGCHKPASFCLEDDQGKHIWGGFYLFSFRHLNSRNSSVYVLSLYLQVREAGIAPHCLSLFSVGARDSLGNFYAMSRLSLKCVPFHTQGNRTLLPRMGQHRRKSHIISALLFKAGI